MVQRELLLMKGVCMAENSLEIHSPTQAQVFELLGETLYLCNRIELMLHRMHKAKSGFLTGKTPKEYQKALMERVKNLQEDDRRPLGPVGLEMLDAIYTPRDDKEIINVEKKPLFAIIISYKIQRKGRLRQAKAKFKKLVDIRNNLVNYFARDYDMAVIESCKKAYDDLKKEYEFIKDVFDFFNSDFQQMMEDLQVIRISLKEKRLRDILNR